MLRVYLCGPINGCDDSECRDWRERFKKVKFIQWIDPLDRDYRSIEDFHVDAIVQGDMNCIQACDVVLMNFTKPSVGSSMEVFFAHSIGKPVVVLHSAPGRLSPWLQYHSEKVVFTEEAVLLWLKEFEQIG